MIQILCFKEGKVSKIKKEHLRRKKKKKNKTEKEII